MSKMLMENDVTLYPYGTFRELVDLVVSHLGLPLKWVFLLFFLCTGFPHP